MEMIKAIAINAPVYIWPLLIALILVGLHSRKERESAIIAMAALPLLAIAGIPNLIALPDQITSWTSWGGAYAIGAIVGFRMQRDILIWRRGARVRVKGEWITLIMVMVIFWTSFSLGVLNAIAPALLGQVPWSILLPALEGIGSGFFLGRVIYMVTARSTSPTA